MTSAGGRWPSGGAAAPRSAAKSATGSDLPPTSESRPAHGASAAADTVTTSSTTASGTPNTASPRSNSSTSMSGQREREQQDDFHAATGLAADLEGAAERVRVALDGVEADAAPGQVGHLARRRVPGLREHVRQRPLVARLL